MAHSGELVQPRRHSDSLADVVEMILDKGLVIDVFVSVKLLGLQLLTVEARVIISSVDTYLRLARAAAELEEEYGHPIIGPLAGAEKGQTLSEFVGDTVGAVTEGGAEHKTKGVVRGAKEAITGKKR